MCPVRNELMQHFDVADSILRVSQPVNLDPTPNPNQPPQAAPTAEPTRHPTARILLPTTKSPTIKSPTPESGNARALSWNERLQLGCAAAGLIAILALAAWLRPDPNGMGTHTQLGLPPCTLSSLTGLRCPGCGMTTSWALVMDGDFETALGTNLGGTLLCWLSMISSPWLLAMAISGRRSRDGWFPWFALLGVAAALGISIIEWIWRLSTALPQ
jgi:hypothetical protein